jgi:hypothetical protein
VGLDAECFCKIVFTQCHKICEKYKKIFKKCKVVNGKR